MRITDVKFLKAKYPQNLEYVVNVFCDPAAFSPSFGTFSELLKNDWIYGAFGLHPHSAKYYTESVENRIIECLKHKKAIAWGEIGLDYAKMNSKKDDQIKAFKRQVLKAVELQLPIIVHSRLSEDDTF